MTDARFQDLRTARAHYNKNAYTVSLNHWAVDIDPFNNVWWINKPDDGLLPTTLHATGVLLTRYQITKDDDPTWRAEIELGKPATPTGRTRIVNVAITGDEIGTTALPLPQIHAACLRVGAVVGLFRDEVGEGSGLVIRTFQISAPLRNDDDTLLHPDDIHRLTGQRPPKPRGYRKSPETLQQVWDALNDFRRHKTERRANGLGKPDETQQQWVARVCGLPESNVQHQINDARKKYGTTTKKNEETK